MVESSSLNKRDLEKQNIEYKREWKDEYLKWICGFANAHGGKLYIGLTNDGLLYSLPNIKKLSEDIPNKIVSYLGLVSEVNILGIAPENYIEIKVSPSDVPVYYKGIYHFRSGSTKQELKGTALTQYLLKKAGKSWDDLVCEGATLDDLDPTAIQYFIHKAMQKKRVADDISKDPIPVLLENLNLMKKDGSIKNAALLLFGKKPMRFVPAVQFKIGRFIDGDDDLRFQDVIEGNILEMADKVMAILESKYLTSPISYEGLQRIEKLEIPEEALREAIFNAIIHKDYTGTSIQLSVYNDKLILWNEGKLPEDYTIETLFSKHPSKPHNKTVADIFFKAGFIEAWGRGISRIINDFRKAGLPDPVFEETMGGIMVTIYRTNDTVTANATDNATDRKTKILKLLSNNSKLSVVQIAKKLEVSRITILRDIDTLKEHNKLQRMGSEKGGYWKVIE
ncbi:MAG: hypothetical protein CVU09_15255 [Bacteroidetes bacterium HGW-Bacteroidetes-4]|jgi:ATP-dependent DNA helicase RecG|nr:MAG: hypothetical protein CVU09_15255 [Bacteroidetes bacterium HGW-Bacteroidetes-4]